MGGSSGIGSRGCFWATGDKVEPIDEEQGHRHRRRRRRGHTIITSHPDYVTKTRTRDQSRLEVLLKASHNII